jgi:cell fate (sporulation/competence/biofilm development) regulator YlbF (YheA/YmcA/DUF963 family)
MVPGRRKSMIFDKVDELSALIEDTKQYDDYLEAEVELENDGHGIDMINAFYDLQQEYIKTYNEGSYDEILAMENVLEMRHTELMNYTTTGNYIRAKEALDELLQLYRQLFYIRQFKQ